MINKFFLFLFIFTGSLYSDSNIVKYKVKTGDYLIKIARDSYKDENKWELIYKANSDKIKDKDLIFPCMILDIPILLEEEKKEKTNEIEIPKQNDVSVLNLTTSNLKNDLKEEKDEKNNKEINYTLVDKSFLNDKFPKNQSSFNISSIRIKVKNDFFDGEIKDNREGKLFVKNDTVDIDLKSKDKFLDKAYIYSVVYEKDDFIFADLVGECRIVKEKNKIRCLISKNVAGIENGMPVKLWK